MFASGSTKWALLAALFVGTGCDSVVKVEPVGHPTVHQEQVSCTTSGYCYTCGPGFGYDGYKMTCGFKISGFCPGSQNALVTYQLQKWLYESGKTRVVNRRIDTNPIGECT